MNPQPKGFNSYHQSHKFSYIPHSPIPHTSIWDKKWPYWVIAALIPVVVALITGLIEG